MKRIVLILTVFAIAIISCSDGSVTRVGDDDNGNQNLIGITDIDDLDKEIRAMVESSTCDDLADCRYIGYGAKPCGGPWTYLTYCVNSVDSTKLDSLVGLYFELDRKRNEEEGIASDCMFVGPPHLGLINGKCEAVSR